MFKFLEQSSGILTNSFPEIVEEPPDGFRGKPEIDFARCTACDRCAAACPTGAITAGPSPEAPGERIVSIDYGRAFSAGSARRRVRTAMHLTREFQLATSDRGALVTRARYSAGAEVRGASFAMTADGGRRGGRAGGGGEEAQEDIRATIWPFTAYPGGGCGLVQRV